MAKYDWKPIEEMDLEDGTHTCYAIRIGDSFWYCTQISDDTWDVEERRVGSDYYTTHVNCKTLTSAKRWVARNVYDPNAWRDDLEKQVAALETKVANLLPKDTLAQKAREARQKANEEHSGTYNSGYLSGYADALREIAGLKTYTISNGDLRIWMALSWEEAKILLDEGYFLTH